MASLRSCAAIKTNYKNHFKVRQGIRFTDPAHNICGIEESTKLVIQYKITKVKDPKTKKVTQKKEEVGRYERGMCDRTGAAERRDRQTVCRRGRRRRR